MPAPALKQVEAAADRLAGVLSRTADPAGSLWQIDGAPTVGKSSCLRLLYDRLMADGALKPILVSPPPHQLDTGPVALADVAVGLARHGYLNGELDAWSAGGATWNERLGQVQRCISKHDDVVILCDEPSAWGANRGGDDFFARRSEYVALFLGALPCRRVVTGKLPVPVSPVERIELALDGTDTAWLRDQGWGMLDEAAAHVAESKIVDRPLTALQLRMLVAVTALESVELAAQWIERDGDGRGIASRLAELLRRKGSRARLWRAWWHLSLTRRGVDEQALEQITPRDLTVLERDIVRHCLLFGEEELQLHDVLRGVAARWRSEHRTDKRLASTVRTVERTLFEINRRRFETLAERRDPAALTASMEAFHFAMASGDGDLIGAVAPAFVEQLDALGWSLSYEHRDYEGAVRAFEHALAWDEAHDYAHHYLAYNLDRLGRRVDEVERHFRRAVELNRSHSWWRSRLIVFLIGRGRFKEARAEWDDAVFVLGLDDGEGSLEIYEHMHCWVARAWLDAGEPLRARETLDAVPDWAERDAHRMLDQRAQALLEAGESDPVIPAWRLRPGWWRAGPERLQDRLGSGDRLVRWMAARVQDRDQEGIRVRAAVLVPGQDVEPEMAWTQLSDEQFDAFCRDDVRARDLSLGSFIEVGLYAPDAGAGKHAETIVRVLPEREWDAPGLSHGDDLRHLRADSVVRVGASSGR